MLRRALVVTAALVVGSVSGAAAIERARPATSATPATTHSPSPADRSGTKGRAAQQSADRATPRAVKADAAASVERTAAPRPALASTDLLNWSTERLTQQLATDLASVGSLSLGRPNAGALVNGIQMPSGEGWEVVDPGRTWGTQETIDYIRLAVTQLHRDFPSAPTVFVGHISRERGGALGPHRSHQSGRDVDLSYIYKPGKHAWYQRASAHTLEVAQSWSLIRALVTEADVDVMFVDLGVQKLLKEHALAIGEDPGWIDALFRYKSNHPEPLIRHAWGHASHIHVRFHNPRAQVLGMRSYDALAELKVIAPRTRVVRYQARPGDTADLLAKRAGTSSAVIQKYNRGNVGALEVGKTYLVPVRGQVAEVTSLTIPPRRLPPSTATTAAVASAPAQAGHASSRRASPSP